jgi:hypothetical protein
VLEVVDVHAHVVVPELLGGPGAAEPWRPRIEWQDGRLGTDYPFDMADPHPVQTVAAAGLGEDAARALLSGNAARELRLTIRS